MSSIEWTDETWNPTVGCSRVSPGCDGCYAIGVAHRAMQPAHAGLTVRHHGRDAEVAGRSTDWTGEVRLLPDRLDTPLRWRKPRRVFVDSMSDLFHPDVLKSDVHAEGSAAPFLASVFAVMVMAEQHTFQVLTKRPQMMRAVLDEPMFRLDVNAELLRRDHSVMPGGMTSPSFRWPANIWLGTSVENQRYADLRIPHLLATPAAVRFLSIEPLLGPVDLSPWLDADLADRPDWVIVGGESGHGARPMHPQWVRALRDQCGQWDVPFFFKQWGEHAPYAPEQRPLGNGVHVELDGSWRSVGESLPSPTAELMRRCGKKEAGRELDGRTWDEMPA
jgi:protein gp37